MRRDAFRRSPGDGDAMSEQTREMMEFDIWYSIQRLKGIETWFLVDRDGYTHKTGSLETVTEELKRMEG